MVIFLKIVDPRGTAARDERKSRFLPVRETFDLSRAECWYKVLDRVSDVLRPMCLMKRKAAERGHAE